MRSSWPSPPEGSASEGAPAAAAPRRVRELERWLRTRCFRSPGGAGVPDRIGVEVELIPLDADTGRPVPLRGGGPAGDAGGTLEVAAAHGASRGWTPSTSPTGSPQLDLPGGGAVSFEPGGQLEVSSPAMKGVDAVARWLLEVVEPLRDEAESRGVRLLARGFDPSNPADAHGGPLQLDAERYRRQAAHYDRRGPWGRRMMRQSAAVHVNLDLGTETGRRWRVANRAAPLLLAAFANSPRAEGTDTGHRSWRAAHWRSLDATRTGFFPLGEDPVPAYLDFVLGADAFLLGAEGEPARPYRAWLERGAGPADFGRHLTTLFPEVRPRGYLELRMFDALPPRWYPAPLAVAAGLLYDPRTLARAEAVLDPPSPEVLERAGREGVRDPALREAARRLLEMGIEGAERLGGAGWSAEVARDYLQRFTAAGRDPGDDPEG